MNLIHLKEHGRWHTLTILDSRQTTNRLNIFAFQNEIKPGRTAINKTLELRILQSICSSLRNRISGQLLRKLLYSFLLLLFLQNEYKFTMNIKMNSRHCFPSTHFCPQYLACHPVENKTVLDSLAGRRMLV